MKATGLDRPKPGVHRALIGFSSGGGFTLRADDTCHADGRVEIFLLHHGRR